MPPWPTVNLKKRLKLQLVHRELTILLRVKLPMNSKTLGFISTAPQPHALDQTKKTDRVTGSQAVQCQIKSAWRKRLWELTHPWESRRIVRCRRRTKQAIEKHVERYVVPFSGWEAGGSPVPRWWEPPPAPTRVLLDSAASTPPMCDGSGAGFGF